MLRTGKWEQDREGNPRCSRCLTPPSFKSDGNDFFSNYCPTCGAGMSNVKVNTSNPAFGAYDKLASDSGDSLKVTEKDGALFIEWRKKK